MAVKNAQPAALHNPRPYLLFDDDTDTLQLGEIEFEGATGRVQELIKHLSREQRTEFKYAQREGFRPVLVVDFETGVQVLEMRRHVPPSPAAK